MENEQAIMNKLDIIKTEIDYINGVLIKLGEKHSIPTPLNNCIYSLVKQIEVRDVKPSEENLHQICMG